MENRIIEKNQIHGSVLVVVGHQSCLLHVGHAQGPVVVSPLAREAQQDLNNEGTCRLLHACRGKQL